MAIRSIPARLFPESDPPKTRVASIAACLCFDSEQVATDLLARMVQAGAFLGPDGHRCWQAGPVGLGHCHFWVTPEEAGEEAGEAQPIGDPASALWLSADVRLDNREELLERLKQTGCDCPPGVSDARLLLACYRVWGTRVFAMLVGDFALALWDGTRQRLVCCRDALGQRPLFYHSSARRFVCASALRQLFCDAEVPQGLSDSTIADHLAGGETEPGSTFFEGVQRLPAGHWLEVGRDGRVQVQRYWDPAAIRLRDGLTAESYAEEFRERFLAAVRARLRARTPRFGLTVSGGVDSSAVAAAAHHLSVTQGLAIELRAFSNVAQRRRADERHYLRELCERYPMPLELTASEDYWAWRPVPGLEALKDEPYEPAYGARLVADLGKAREHGITVLLTGSGGDEVGGSSWYLVDLLAHGQILRFWPELRARARGKHAAAFGLLRTLAHELMQSWRRSAGIGMERTGPEWLGRNLADRRDPAGHTWDKPVHRNPARESVYQQVRAWWASPVLSALSGIPCSFGIEIRHPFLDRRVVEWALSLPPYRFGREGRLKAPLRQGLADVLPRAIAERADKGDYLYYWDLGLRHRERPRILRMLEAPAAADCGYIDADKLRCAYQRYCRGGRINRRQLWNTLTLEAWLRGR